MIAVKFTISVVTALFGRRAELVEYRICWTGRFADWKSKTGNWCKMHLKTPIHGDTLQEWSMWESWGEILENGLISTPTDLKVLVPVFSDRLMPALTPLLMPRYRQGIETQPPISFGSAARVFGHARKDDNEVVLGIDEDKQICFASVLTNGTVVRSKKTTLREDRLPNGLVCLVSESKTIRGSLSALGIDFANY